MPAAAPGRSGRAAPAIGVHNDDVSNVTVHALAMDPSAATESLDVLLAHALDEAAGDVSRRVTSGHLLLGMLRMEGSTGMMVLNRLGITLETVHERKCGCAWDE